MLSQDEFDKFQMEIFETIQKHFPGAMEGQTQPHASATAALAVTIGTLLQWMLAKNPGQQGEDNLKWACDYVAKTASESAHTGFDASMKMRDEMLPHYVPGNPETKQ